MSARYRVRREALYLGLLVIVVLAPAFLFPLPPVIDYPNHLARMWLVAGGDETAPLSNFYSESWQYVGSGIGIDLAAQTFSPWISPFVIGFILLMLAIVLPAAGAIALNARLFGGINSWQPFFLLFWCCETLVGGFLNFQIGLGAALLGAAVDPILQRRSVGLLYSGRIAIAITLMLIHPFALVFYMALLAATAFGAGIPTPHEITPRLRRAAGAMAVGLIPLALFFLHVQAVPGSDAKTAKLAIFNDLTGTAHALLSPIASYDYKIDFLFALFFAALVAWGVAKRRFAVHTSLLFLAAAFAMAAVVMPNTIGHTGWMDRRLPLMAVLTGLAATRLDFGPQRRSAMLAAAAALVLLRSAWIGLNWSASVPMVDAMRTVLADVPAGAKVLAMQHLDHERDGFFHVLGRSTAAWDETFRHYPAMMVPWRHAFTPMMFAQFREKPVTVRPPYDKIADPTGGTLPSVAALNRPKLLSPRTQYIAHWRENFDYVLVLNADRPDRYGPFVRPKELEPIADSGFAQLYRVRHPAASTPRATAKTAHI